MAILSSLSISILFLIEIHPDVLKHFSEVVISYADSLCLLILLDLVVML